MITILVLFRNARPLAGQCLQSLQELEQSLGLSGAGLEYLLIDDCSDDAAGIPAMLREFRSSSRAGSVSLLRFRRHLHYTHGLAVGLSVARGDLVLFLSHDMILPRSCAMALMETAAAAPEEVAVFRPRSAHMDQAEEAVLAPPLAPRKRSDIEAFAAYVREYHGPLYGHVALLTGDAMLIRRRAIEKIGVPDTRFRGFFGDVDYGLRLERAGLRHAIAGGAWLHHVGGGAARDRGETPEQWEATQALNRTDVAAAYQVFRDKWREANLPANLADLRREMLQACAALPSVSFNLFQPPVAPDPQWCEVLK